MCDCSAASREVEVRLADADGRSQFENGVIGDPSDQDRYRKSEQIAWLCALLNGQSRTLWRRLVERCVLVCTRQGHDRHHARDRPERFARIPAHVGPS